MVGTSWPYVVRILEEGPAGLRAELADVPGVEVTAATRAELPGQLARAIEADFDRKGNAVDVEHVGLLRTLDDGREEHSFRLSPA